MVDLDRCFSNCHSYEHRRILSDAIFVWREVKENQKVMLTASQIDLLPYHLVDLYDEFQSSIINDIARRLAGLDFAKPTAAWQMQRLSESGMVYEDILKALEGITGRSEAELRAMFSKAGVKAIKFDDSIYEAAGLNPRPLNLSPAMSDVLAAGLRKTGGVLRNLTQSMAISGQEAFTSAADLAYMQVTSGAFSYDQAIRQAVKQVAGDGLTVINFANGRADQLDVAVRRAVLTGVNQTVGQMQTSRADEMGVDLVETSAHAGSRPEHQLWQGKVFSRSGTDKRYPPFVESTGYGTVTGLCGANCRHSFFGFIPGISRAIYDKATLEELNTKVTYNGKEITTYEATQEQRAIERKIRYWKRQQSAIEAAGQDSTAEAGKVKAWQSQMRDFIEKTKLSRQRAREQV